ncbi:DUF4199 domain-containing protein [Cytophagaceae bacterium YF14B1]|uniref:DUF4199 domain-containing protein n=1 Tax=Xanthocytophaga flava TaxID=3048013 RepID=A0AAE3U955_9BACT|nr:DUF4199 domain-containing protein [Xanthocytophaga flavus]MDJ1481893.1 DUF4199 domain-containing protein [Xanthocytophaga flavus]
MNPYLRIALIFGTVAGLSGIAYFLVLQYEVGEPALTRLSTLDIIITLLCIIYAMGYFRDRKQNGVLHFWEGAVIGIGTAIIGTLLMCLVIYGIVVFLDPDVFKNFILYLQKDMSQRLTSDVITKSPQLQQMIRTQLAALPQITPFDTIFFPGGAFVKNIGIEILVIGMIAAIMRKNVNHLSQKQETEVKKKK